MVDLWWHVKIAGNFCIKLLAQNLSEKMLNNTMICLKITFNFFLPAFAMPYTKLKGITNKKKLVYSFSQPTNDEALNLFKALVCAVTYWLENFISCVLQKESSSISKRRQPDNCLSSVCSLGQLLLFNLLENYITVESNRN